MNGKEFDPFRVGTFFGLQHPGCNPGLFTFCPFGAVAKKLVHGFDALPADPPYVGSYDWLRFRRFLNLRGHYEIAFREAVDLVGPERDLHFAPGEIDIGMMILSLGHFPHAIRKVERLAEVFEFIFFFKMMFLHDLPLVSELPRKFFQRIALQWRHSALARHARLTRQILVSHARI